MTKQSNKVFYKQALLLAVPMMVQNGITNMVSLIDNVMVGSLGTEAMTAVSIVGQLIFVFNLSIFGGLSGPGIYGAQFFGQNNQEGFRSTFRLKHWIAAFCTLAGILIFLFGDELLIRLYLQGETGGVEPVDPIQTMVFGKQYLHIMIVGLLPFAVTQVYASSLRETGCSVTPMVAGILSVVVDIVFNYFLIFGKFGFPEMGVQGAAVATVLARFVEMTVVVTWSFLQKQRHTFLQGIYRTLLIPKEFVIKMLQKSLPIFCNEFLWASGIAVLTQCYSSRGLEIVAGLNISNAICNLLNVVFVALGSAVGILVGQTLGASEYEKARKQAFSLMWFTGGICTILTAILITVSSVFPLFYDTTQEIRRYGTYFIIITALFFPVQGFLNTLYFTLRSGGKTVITFLFDSVYTWILPIPVAWVLCHLTGIPILVIYTIVQAADLIKIAVGYMMIRKGVWISNLAQEASHI